MLTIQKHKCAALYSVILGLVMLLCPHPAGAVIDADNSNAVVFVYQHIGDDSVPQGNISVDQFREHVKELKTGGYNVLPLPRVIDALKSGDPLPQRTVAITFDGAYVSTVNTAKQILDDADLPFTVFFASDMADGASPAHMTWSQLKDLKGDRRVTLGILPATYSHMVGLDKDKDAALINKAVDRYRTNFGEAPQFFAYPYGEFSNELKKQISGYAFKAAFGQQSGVIYGKSDFMALPRFTMTDNFGDLDRFQTTAGALPMPVTDVIPEDPALNAKENPPQIGFTITPDIKDISHLACFVSGIGKVTLDKPGGNRVEIRLKDPLEDRRTRVNCTMPDAPVNPGERQSWRWFGMLLVMPDYDEDTTPPANNDDDSDGSPGSD